MLAGWMLLALDNFTIALAQEIATTLGCCALVYLAFRAVKLPMWPTKPDGGRGR